MKLLSTGITSFLAANPLLQLLQVQINYAGGNEEGGGSESSGDNNQSPPPDPDDPVDTELPGEIDRPEDFGRARRYYVLLVGINNYPTPISPLNGCIKDLDQIDDWLKEKLGDPEDEESPVKRLRIEDENATYENIIEGFKHLRQAKEQDVVWFHFSGHGAEDLTAAEFKASLEPAGKDQTLVCYREKGSGDQLYLADKELAWLLHEVATKDHLNKKKDNPPHMVVTLDCCHSGTGTRDFEIDPQLKTRNADALDLTTRMNRVGTLDPRPINSYYGGYEDQWNKGAEKGKDESIRMEVPVTPHVLLAACESVQTAGDLPKGGVFTNGLIDALKASGGKISYADLFSQTQASVYKIRKDQNPQFEPVGNFYPYTRFLDGSPMGSPMKYELAFEVSEKIFADPGKWVVHCGAIHGLPVSPKVPIEVKVLQEGEEPIIATVKQTGAQKSPISLPAGVSLDPETTYEAVLHFLPVPREEVWLHGSSEEVLKAVRERMSNSLYVKPVSAETKPESVLIEIEITDDAYIIRDHKRDGKQVLHSEYDLAVDPTERQNDLISSSKLITADADKMVKWERFIRLNNPMSKIREWVDLKIDILDKGRTNVRRLQGVQVANEEGQEKRLPSDIDIPITEPEVFVHGNNHFAWFQPKLVIKESAQELFCYLFHLRSSYSIESYDGEIIYRPEEYEGMDQPEIPMLKKPKAWGIEQHEQSTTSYFKLLVTTEELSYEKFMQTPIGPGHRDLMLSDDFDPDQIDEDWCAITIKVSLTKPNYLS